MAVTKTHFLSISLYLCSFSEISSRVHYACGSVLYLNYFIPYRNCYFRKTAKLQKFEFASRPWRKIIFLYDFLFPKISSRDHRACDRSYGILYVFWRIDIFIMKNCKVENFQGAYLYIVSKFYCPWNIWECRNLIKIHINRIWKDENKFWLPWKLRIWDLSSLQVSRFHFNSIFRCSTQQITWIAS